MLFLKVKCEQEMRVDCKGDIMNKSKTLHGPFPQTGSNPHKATQHHCSDMSTCSALTSGS